MRRLFFAVIIVLEIVQSALAQDFNAKNGYIFDQKFVTRITTTAASKLLGVSDIDGEFMPLYDRLGKAHDSTLPQQGVRRAGNTIVLQAPGKPKLSLTDFVYRGKEDTGDSQRFSYIKALDRFHVLVVAFDHDRPCFMLVEKASLKVYFVDY